MLLAFAVEVKAHHALRCVSEIYVVQVIHCFVSGISGAIKTCGSGHWVAACHRFVASVRIEGLDELLGAWCLLGCCWRTCSQCLL